MSERKALVVDDDVSIRLLVSRVLTRCGFEVEAARDGAEAIEKLNDADYDIVILDLMMPRLDGVAVVRHLSEHAPEKIDRVIVLTAFGAAATSKVSPPVTRFLHKPFDIDALVREVEGCMAAQKH